MTLYFRAGAQIKLGNYEAEDRAGEYQNAAITANELNMVIQFLLFGAGCGWEESHDAGKRRMFPGVLYGCCGYGGVSGGSR